MAESTGPILAIGAIAMANRSIFHDKPVDWRVPVATGIAALMFTGAERVWGPGTKLLAWTALVAMCLTRVEPDVPSPVESALDWFNSGAAPAKKKPPAGSGKSYPA